MWELDCEERWAPKNWCFWTVLLEKTLASPLDSKEIQPVHPKRNQSWIFIGRTDAKAETPILWPPDLKNWLTGKDPDAGKDWRQEEKGTTEDEMVGWRHRLNEHEFKQTPGVGDGQGGLACCDSWCRRVGHDWTTELNWKIDPWVQVLSDSFIHYYFPISLSFNCISSLYWSLPRSIRRKDFLLLLGRNYLFLFYWSFSQLSNISRWSSKDNSMWNALKHNRKGGGKTDLKNHAWNGGWKPDHVGSFRNNEGFQCLFQE